MEKTKIVIRMAKMEDAEVIASLSNQLGYVTNQEEITKRLQSILGHSENVVYVATYLGKVVGWIHGFYSLRVESDPFVEIGGLVVDEAHWKMGFGKMLILRIVEWAEHFDCKKIRVRSNITRVESHEFYLRIGFTLSKEQKIFNLEIS
jgi:GNAT superfamily N-acetyltransferase